MLETPGTNAGSNGSLNFDLLKVVTEFPPFLRISCRLTKLSMNISSDCVTMKGDTGSAMIWGTLDIGHSDPGYISLSNLHSALQTVSPSHSHTERSQWVETCS